MTGLAGLGVLELARLLQERDVSSREVASACLREIEDGDGAIGAWARTYPELALEQAADADERLSARAVASLGPPPLLCGVPIGVKDVIAVAGQPLTLGSEAFATADATATADAAAWARLRAEGAVLIGHNSAQELALGNAPQAVRNPWDPTRSPGGSSSGSAAAVAAGTVPATLGTDVGGSLRRPASACGLTTVMATAGAVSTNGVFTFDAMSDHVGPLAFSAADCAALLDSIASNAPPLADLRSAAARTPPAARGRRGHRVGLARSGGEAETAAAVGAVLERFAGELAALGATLVEVTPPPPPALDRRPRQEQVDFFRAQLPARGPRFSRPVREHGVALLRSAAREGVRSDRANRDAIGRWRRAWDALFAERRLDALALPAQLRETPALPAPGVGGDMDRFGDSGVRSAWNALGFPVVCVPAGPTGGSEMPLGVQLAGLPGSEAVLLGLAIEYQVATQHHRRRPGAAGDGPHGNAARTSGQGSASAVGSCGLRSR